MPTGIPVQKQKLIMADCYYKFTDMLEIALKDNWTVVPGTLNFWTWYNDKQERCQEFLVIVER